MREKAFGVELDGFAVPLLSGGDVVLAELEEAHGFVGEGVVGIVAERGFEERLGFFGAAVVDEDVGADGVGFRGWDGAGLEGGGIDGERGVHFEHGEAALLHIVLEGSLKLVQVSEGVLGGGDGVFAFDEEPGIVGEVVSAFLVVGDLDVVGEGPGFGVEDGAFLLVVVVRGGVVDLEENVEGNEASLTEEVDVV